MQISRESIFISSIRAFFVALLAFLGLAVGIFIAMIGFSIVSRSDYTPKKSVPTIVADANGNREALGETVPVLVRINLRGVIGDRDLTTEKIEDILIDSRNGIFQKGRVKGILLVITTPGGTVSDSWGIYNALKNYREKYDIPIYAFVEGMSASGGYYISMACDQIYANPSSVIGSIGVLYGPFFNFTGGMEKLGISAHTFTAGKGKDTLNPFRSWEDGEFKPVDEVMKIFYDDFVNVVTANRPQLSREDVMQNLGAQVFASSQAEELGVIDNGNSSYYQALAALATAAGIGEDEKYQVFEMHTPHSFFLELTEGKSPIFTGKVEHTLTPPSSEIPPSLAGKWLYYHHPLANR